jgi:hypothetical protein
MGHPLDIGRRQAIPLRVDRVFRLRVADSEIYYLEINRQDIPIESTDPGSCFSVLKSWVQDAAGTGPIAIDTEFGLSDCDGRTGMSDTPVVYWENSGSVELLVRRLGYEAEWFAILTINDAVVTQRTNVNFRHKAP